MDNFIKLCLRTESARVPSMHNGKARLLHAGMGIVTESAEFMDALKKSFFYGKPIDDVNLREELGDILWYISIALDELGSTYEAEMDRVIRKLQKRFPEKFTDEDALNRDLDEERKELEK